MFRIFCKSKIHRAKVTETALHYKGSIGIDRKLLAAADIKPYEMVQVVNVNNGARFETYAIEEKALSGKIILYGPAARLGEVGDRVIILSSCMIDDRETTGFKTKLVHVNDKNRLGKK